jgi:nitroreductase
MLKELLLKNRSYRRFVQDVRITREELTEWVGLTRYCASGRNAQALKYKVVADVDLCDKVFPNLAWAGYLKDCDGWKRHRNRSFPGCRIKIVHDSKFKNQSATSF